MKIKKNYLKKHLEGVFNNKISDFKVSKLGKGVLGIGYALDFKINGQHQRKILKTLYPVHLGQDYFSDRAQSLILAHNDYQKMDKHISSFDACGLQEDGQVISVGQAKEFFILMDEAKGQDYFSDIIRIAKTNRLTKKDQKRAELLADYLIKLHRIKQKSPSLYQRKIRDTIGSGQSIMGVLDSYPQKLSWLSQPAITQIVQKTIEFWSKDRFKFHRLCQVHGDFHPGNIWWQSKDNFILLDRARGEFGEAADDITALLINYIFFSAIYQSRGLNKLLDIFTQRYFQKTQDQEIMEVIQPYFVFRTVVVCHPGFYPDSFYPVSKKANDIRRQMINFANNILATKKFSFSEINNYFCK